MNAHECNALMYVSMCVELIIITSAHIVSTEKCVAS